MGEAFRAAVAEFAHDHDVPVIRFKRGERKIDVVRPYLDEALEPGVVALGVAQEIQRRLPRVPLKLKWRSSAPW
jgi:hypothetical protein